MPVIRGGNPAAGNLPVIVVLNLDGVAGLLDLRQRSVDFGTEQGLQRRRRLAVSLLQDGMQVEGLERVQSLGVWVLRGAQKVRFRRWERCADVVLACVCHDEKWRNSTANVHFKPGFKLDSRPEDNAPAQSFRQ